MIPDHLQPAFDPIAHPDAVVQGPGARFTVLTPRLLRLEYHPADAFEDRASQAFWYRRQPVPAFTATADAERIVIETAALRLEYHVSAAGFTPETLAITLKETGATWRYGGANPGNLRGTARTLDHAFADVPLEPGLMSRDGWSVVDDSRALVFDADGWLESRDAPETARDLYFFGYGRDYQGCLRDYCKLAGDVPLLPRWALGNWWSRYWPYSQDELMRLMRDFEAHEVPLSVCIVDIDWHIRETGNQCRGWTGYTWERSLFPDPAAFFAFLREKGLKTALNLHPHEGVHPHEEAYPAMARRMGVDPDTEAPIPFDIADPDFTHAYLEELHHPLEADGVDFWWMDWQQGAATRLPGLDPLWWLNHLHFYDLARTGERRPFIFSRWGGLGNHRYPIGFSGDTYVTWDVLAFQTYFTATAANVGYSWWSHDIGGHMGGIETGEIYARWVQFGVFSPIFRLHSTANPFHERRPWGYDDHIFRVTRDAMQLRHALIPYLYTLSWRNATEFLPPVRPMYHAHPAAEAAYACPHQYYFGDLVVAPFVAPAAESTQLSRQVVWLPEGEWTHFFTGEHFDGGKWYALYGDLDALPVFAPAGAIVPLGPRVGWGGVGNPAALDVHVFAGADGDFTLYEDDGESLAYLRGASSRVAFAQRWSAEQMTVSIAPAKGATGHLPAERVYRLHLHGIAQPGRVDVRVDGEARPVEAIYDAATETLRLAAFSAPLTAAVEVTLAVGEAGLRSRRDRAAEKCRAMLHAFRMETLAKQALAAHLSDFLADPAFLGRFRAALSDTQARALLEVAHQAGIHRIRHTVAEELVLVWNNRADPRFTYLAHQWRPDCWSFEERYVAAQGPAPQFTAITPVTRYEHPEYPFEVGLHLRDWRVQMNYADIVTVEYSGEEVQRT